MEGCAFPARDQRTAAARRSPRRHSAMHNRARPQLPGATARPQCRARPVHRAERPNGCTADIACGDRPRGARWPVLRARRLPRTAGASHGGRIQQTVIRHRPPASPLGRLSSPHRGSPTPAQPIRPAQARRSTSTLNPPEATRASLLEACQAANVIAPVPASRGEQDAGQTGPPAKATSA